MKIYLLKFLSLLFTLLLLAISCKSPEKAKELKSIGTLSASPDSTTITLKNPIDGREKSGAITIKGFNDSFKKEVKDITDVLYTVKKITVTGVQATSPLLKSVPTKEEVQASIGEGSFILVSSDKNIFDEVVISFANAVGGQSTEDNIKKIAKAIKTGNTASITLTVEASGNGNTEDKYKSATFDIRFGLIVQSEQ